MSTTNERLLSIDVLRGMTIFFMIIVNTPGTWTYVYAPLLHAKWHGCTPTDLVFPFFMYIVGVSMAFSFLKYQTQDRNQWISKVLKRTALIFLVGLLLNWFPFYHKNIADLRIFGVLQRIALGFGGAGLLIILLKDKVKLAIATTVILFAYWVVMYWGGSTDPYSLEGNLATWLDVKLFGESHIYKGFGIPFDPEGLVSTITGVAHVLIGYLVGLKVQELSSQKSKLIQHLLPLGIILCVLGLIWNIGFPINKPIWTSSYVLYTTGWATLFLAILIWAIDVKGWQKWTYVFRVFGLNPLASYALSIIFVKIMITIFQWEGGNLYSALYQNIFQNLFGNYLGSFLFALIFTLFIWLFAWLLYRQNKVIKI